MPLLVRRAQPEDLETIVRFNAAMAQETEHLSLSHERLRKGVASILADPSKGLYFVAELAGRVIGQIMLTYEWSDWRNGTFWWVQSVYVDPDYRGQRVFRTLYEHVAAEARRNPEVCGLRLYVERENSRAQQVYAQLGMKQTAYLLFEDDFVLGAAGPRQQQ